MKLHKLKRGLNIPLTGKPEPSVETFTSPDTIGISPLEFHGIKAKLNVKEGDSVKAGQILFFDKRDERIRFPSPGSGKVKEIQYGERMAIERIILSPEGDQAVEFPSENSASIASMKRDVLVDRLLESGIWIHIRQRPFDRIAIPDHLPSSIFVNAMDTAPAAADQEVQLQSSITEYKAGIEALKVLAAGKPVHVVVPGKNTGSPFLNVEGVQKHGFTGKHPAGLVGTHIHRIDPLGTGKTVWFLNARDVALIGSFLLNGRYPTERTIALSGPGLKKTFYVKTKAGARAGHLLREIMKEGKQRVIGGNALTGRTIGEEGFVGTYDGQITVIPEGGKRTFLGWMLPGFKLHSNTGTVLSSFLPVSNFKMDTSLNGEERAFVMTGSYRRVMGIDLYPDFLAKAIMIEDIEGMEKMGILEAAPEDVALCSYICPSKIEFTEIYRQGLDLFEAEMG